MTGMYPFQHVAQAGLTLLEVLVAMLVLSFGALGMVSLGSIAARDQQLALFHHRAVVAVEDLSGRLRANPSGAAAYAGAPSSGQCSSFGSPAVPCDPTALAAHDLSEWQDHHLAGLPAGTAGISIATDEGRSAVRIALAWTVRGRTYHLEREVPP
jgi:type IV pilus assembly protein PilV